MSIIFIYKCWSVVCKSDSAVTSPFWFKSSVEFSYPNICISDADGDESGKATRYDDMGIGELLEGCVDEGACLLFTGFRRIPGGTICPSLKNDILGLIKIVVFHKSLNIRDCCSWFGIYFGCSATVESLTVDSAAHGIAEDYDLWWGWCMLSLWQVSMLLAPAGSFGCFGWLPRRRHLGHIGGRGHCWLRLYW